MGHGQIDSDEVELAQKSQRGSQFIRSNMKARVLHVDVALLEGGVLDLRREGMRDRVTKDAKADWRIDITRRFSPIFEVSERVTLCRSFLFLHSAEHCRYSDP